MTTLSSVHATDCRTRMAKELSIEDKLKALYQLQQVNSKIDELRTLAGELPQEVKDMADEVEGLKTRLDFTLTVIRLTIVSAEVIPVRSS